MAGRPPKPTQLKIIEGNPGKRPLNTNEPQYAADAVRCPMWLDPDAKREWRRVVKLLKANHLATEADVMALAAYCQAYARWKLAEQELSKRIEEDGGLYFCTPQGYRQQHPEVSIAQKNQQLMLQAAAKFGLDPSSRSKLSLPTNNRDELDDVLSGRSG